jgi:hypothetical protein
MTSRRSFFKSLISLVAAPKVAAALPVAKLHERFPVIFRKIFPETISHDLVDVQPMSDPVDLVFHMNYVCNKYNNNV